MSLESFAGDVAGQRDGKAGPDRWPADEGDFGGEIAASLRQLVLEQSRKG